MASHENFAAIKRTVLLFLIFPIVTALDTTLVHGLTSRSKHERLSRNSFPHTLSERSLDLNSTLVARGIDAWSGASFYEQKGTSGIGAMQLTAVNDRYVLLFDKAEQNPLRTSDGNHAWAAMLDTYEGKVRALKTETNSFCAGGGWLSDGTIANFGGNPREGPTVTQDGIMAVRLIKPLPDGSGEIFESPQVKLTSHRWYPSSARISDGSQIVFGGMTAGGFNNAPATDNPTIEFYPPKGNGKAIYSKFLAETLPSNLFPHVFTLPDNRIFVAANRKAMIYDWKTNTEQRLPDFPNGVRVNYPWSAGAVLLPLTPENNYTPEVLFCGGSTIDDKMPSTQMSSQTPASKQCARMVLTKDGILKGWQVENMPDGRLMIDAILMPDGNVLLINGAKTGLSGYGNVKDQIGQSNADHPYNTPWLYRPNAPKGSRFQQGLGTTNIPRMYHSSASLLADGSVIVAGSNPNADVSGGRYPTEYRVEYFRPPYYKQVRPSFTGKPPKVNFGETFTLQVSNPGNAATVKAAILDLGFHTHGVSLGSKYVGLKTTYDRKTGQMKVTAPPNSYIYPKGPAWIYLIADGVPSKGSKIMIGDGAAPP